MKKWILISVLLLGLLAALVACDSGTPSETTPQDTSAADTSAADTSASDKTDVATDVDDTDATPAPSDTANGEEGKDTDAPSDTTTDGNGGAAVTPGKVVHVSNDELRLLNGMGDEIGQAFEPGGFEAWTSRSVTIGQNQVAVMVDWGWVAFDSTDYVFGYVVNGESFFSETYAREPEDAVRSAAQAKGATNCARFYGGLTTEALRLGNNQVQFCVRLDGDVLCVLREYTVNVSSTPVSLNGGSYLVGIDSWTVSGHKAGITAANDPTHGGMVAAGGVDKGALLHCGAIGVGKVDLSKYSKVVIHYGCDASSITQDYYNQSPHNRFLLTSEDTNGASSPEARQIIASATYTLHGWGQQAMEIDLTGINYNGPVYVTVDALPGTFMLVTSIEFIR